MRRGIERREEAGDRERVGEQGRGEGGGKCHRGHWLTRLVGYGGAQKWPVGDLGPSTLLLNEVI